MSAEAKVMDGRLEVPLASGHSEGTKPIVTASTCRQVTTIVGVYVTRWKPKSCPRCRGDMFMGNDEDGWYQKCLQCSYLVEPDEEADSTKKSARNHAAQARRERPVLQSAEKHRSRSRIEGKEDNLRVITEEEWQALKRQNLSREMWTQQAERI